MNNYSNTEKSLKRWLKTKVKVTMATVVGFLIAGTVAMGADTISVTEPKEYSILSTYGVSGKALIGITAKEDAYRNEIEENVNISFSGKYDMSANGIHLEATEIGNKNSAEKLVLTGNKINIDIENTGEKATNGIMNSSGGNLTLGNKNSIINIDVEGGYAISGQVSGISTTGNIDRKNGSDNKTGLYGSTTIVNGKELNINAVSNKADLLVGISVNNVTTHDNETVKNGTMCNMTINSEKTKIELENKEGKYATGIAIYSNGTLNVNGDLEVIVKDGKNLLERTAIGVRGNSITKVNADGKHTVKLDGNILFDYPGTDNGNTSTDLTVNLSNSDSFLKGKIYKADNTAIPGENGHGMKLGLSNGGKWEVTGDSFVNDLTMNGGVLEVTDDVNEINVDRLHGDSGIVMFAASIDGDNVNVADGQINIGEVKDNTSFEVGFSGINADDLAGKDLNKAFGELADKVNVTTGADKVDETYFAKEGQVTGEITAKDDGNGNLVITQAEESKTVRGLKDLATINYLSWKQEMGSLTQRMGELRDSSAEHGVWARVYGGKVENGSQYDNEYQTYQVGYDKKYSVDNGRVYLGYLVSYTDGETDYDLGHGENYSVGAGIYATWMNNNGHYVDVLYKVSRLNNKFDVNGTNGLNSKGKYDTYGISLSAEYGKRFDITEKWFAEPSIGMHLGRLGEETYTTDSGIEVSQDSIYTAEGRIGTAVGYKFNDKGNVYARTHVVKEFAGDVDAEYTANGATSNTSEDMGDTWFEFGVGVNYRFAENVNVYADIEKSGDATVDTEWQGNLGFRYEF